MGGLTFHYFNFYTLFNTHNKLDIFDTFTETRRNLVKKESLSLRTFSFTGSHSNNEIIHIHFDPHN